MSGIALEEYELLGEARYRSYISSIDKALKSFEYTSEWADLISALGKLNKVLLGNVKYSIIPRRITISKRLAQCMHPALPSGVHLKALETYDIIFKCIGASRLSQELFIYSAGLFPLLGNAAMNVKPSLLSIYENHFVPLGTKLRPGLNGFLIGVLPGLEEGSEYYERTDELLLSVCGNVGKSFFYGCMWKCILSNPAVRLPAVSFIISHYNRRLCMEDQLYIIGTDIDTMVQGLCSSLQDNSVLVQRCALDLLLLGFPIHSNQLLSTDMVKVVTSALTVVLRRDMSLNRRLFSWLMGGDALGVEEVNKGSIEKFIEQMDGNCYFKDFSKDYLLKALQKCFDNPQTVMTSNSVPSNAELWCYRLLISLLDRPEISSVILDDILIDIFRSLYLACHSTKSIAVEDEKRNQKSLKDQNELKKAANLLFGTLEPSYLWEYSAKNFESSCSVMYANHPICKNVENDIGCIQRVGSGNPTLVELCSLVSFLLDVVSLETYLEAKTEHLPKLLCRIFNVLSVKCKNLPIQDISTTLKLCSKILCKMQPPLINITTENFTQQKVNNNIIVDETFDLFGQPDFIMDNEQGNNVLSKSLSEFKIQSEENTKSGETFTSIRSIISLCVEKYQHFFVTFLKEKVFINIDKSLELYNSLLLPKKDRQVQREKNLDKLLHKCLSAKCKCVPTQEIDIFKQEIMKLSEKNIDDPFQELENIPADAILCEAFERLCNLLVEISSFPTFYTNSRELYEKHLHTSRSSVIPEWLKMIVTLACYVSNDELFFNATSTLFDLITLTKSVIHNEEINEVAPLPCSLENSKASQTNNSPTVVLVALTPTVSASQLEFLSNETLLFYLAANKLWTFVGDERPNFSLRGTELLQQVHNLSPSSSVCEAVICSSMASGDETQQVEAQKKFSILWHLTRDLNLKSTPSTMTRNFDRCLFQMLDNLGKETGPQKAISQGWLNHSLQRGDVARFLEPLLLILLHPDSARVSIQHVSVHCPKKLVSDDRDNQNHEDAEAKVYAISSTSGHVIYHISDDSHPSSHQPSPDKKILALTRVLDVDSKKGSTVVTHNSMLQDFEVPSSHERDLKLPISVFVNPFGSLSSLGSDSHLDYITLVSPDLSQAKRMNVARRSSFEEDLVENEIIVEKEMTIESIVSSVLDDIISQVVNNEADKDYVSSGDFNFTDDYNDSCDLNSTYKRLSEFSASQLTVHPLHTYILLYCQVYDSQKTLYALYSLKAIILTNPRIALCSISTTNISNSLSLRGQKLQVLLARHRKSVFGNNFHGELTAEATTMFRSNTYVEVIVAACLYHIRSHYPNLPHVKLTEDEVLGNRNVRLLCMEVLTLVFSELVGIVKDSGKCFASYLSDLLHRSKVQKTLLHCLAASVYDSQPKVYAKDGKNHTFTETIVEFNEKLSQQCQPNESCSNDFQDTYQVHLLRLMATLIVLEDTILSQNASDKDSLSNVSKNNDIGQEKKIYFRPNAHTSTKFQPGIPVPCQSMFLSAVLTALRLEHHAHLHIHWLSLVTSALPFVGRWLPRLVMTVVSQLCINLENAMRLFWISPSESDSHTNENSPKPTFMPPDYLITLIEGLTTLCHYCLLECPAPVLSPLNQPPLPPVPSQPYAPGNSASQIISNLIHVFSTSSNQKDVVGRDSVATFDPILSARRVLLSNLPKVISSITSLFRVVTEVDKENQHREWWIMGTPKVVKQHILSFLSPISLNHGPHFMAAIAVVWHESRNKKITQTRKVIPSWSNKQLLLVELVAAIKVFPLESIVQTVRTVLKQPPSMSQKIQVAIEVNTLQFFLAYIQQTSGSQLLETWQALLGLWRDGLQITYPLVQFHLLGILHEFVQRSPLLEEKKSQKDLQDIAHKLIESCSAVACDSLEQTTWLWRNLAVRPGPQSDIAAAEEDDGQNLEENTSSVSSKSLAAPSIHSNAQYSVQALCTLAEFLASVLDFVYVGEEKEKVLPLLGNIMHYVTPYLKNHSSDNIPSFRACCQLLANISGYQHTRKAWRKEAFELLLDSSFFQMSSSCIGYWRSIIDHLMTHDKTTFRDFMSRVSVTQSGSLNLFSSKEQEYEQRAQLLKRLAFVIFCSEIDQYQKYMPDIQERLTESLRISHVPLVQAQIFLCFRVLLVRMTPHHVTSLWPVIITEMVQVFTQIEYDLCVDSEEFSDGVGLRKNISSHIRRMSTLDSTWITNSSNGLNAHNHPAWLHLYLSVCKLLDMTVALPANILPQFQMYRWAFIGDSPPLSSDMNENCESSQLGSPDFVPHIIRLANLLNKKVPSDERLPFIPGKLLLTMSNINSILHLQTFFNTLSNITNQATLSEKILKPEKKLLVDDKRASPISKSRSAPNLHTLTSAVSMLDSSSAQSISEQIEMVLESDFLELCT